MSVGAALAGALAAMCKRIEGLRTCPDCEASLEEGAWHADGCPVGVALEVLRSPEASAYARQSASFQAVAEEAARLVTGSFTSVGGEMVKCGSCGLLSVTGVHAADCPLAALSAALLGLAVTNGAAE